MDLINKLSKKTIKYFEIENIIIETFSEQTIETVEKIIKFFRKKDVKVTTKNVLQLAENGLYIAYSEIIKCLIVLFVAYLLNIFLPVLIVMNVFSLIRGFAGGNHMSTFNKCFMLMLISFILFGLMSTYIYIDFIIIIVLYILSLLFAYKYSPVERQDKSDKDKDNGNRFKKVITALILLCFLMSIILLRYDKHVLSNAITLGVILEMITVTPLGIRFFAWLDGGNK